MKNMQKSTGMKKFVLKQIKEEKTIKDKEHKRFEDTGQGSAGKGCDNGGCPCGCTNCGEGTCCGQGSCVQSESGSSD